MARSVMTAAQLLALNGAPSNIPLLLEQLINTVFVPRFVRIDGTSLTIKEDHRGAFLRFTSASAITVTLPATLPAGFLLSFIQYGAGAIAFSGAVIGGTASAGQSKVCSAMKLDTGEWLISGGA